MSIASTAGLRSLLLSMEPATVVGLLDEPAVIAMHFGRSGSGFSHFQSRLHTPRRGGNQPYRPGDDRPVSASRPLLPGEGAAHSGSAEATSLGEGGLFVHGVQSCD